MSITDGFKEFCNEHQILERWCAKHYCWEYWCPRCKEWNNHNKLVKKQGDLDYWIELKCKCSQIIHVLHK